MKCADTLAARLEREAPQHERPEQRIARVFQLAIGRDPDDRERPAALRFVLTQPERYAGLSQAVARRCAWADFCQMVLASNAFLYLE